MVFQHGLDDGEAGDGFDPGLGLAGFGGLGAETVNEGLHVRFLRGDAAGHGGLLGGAFGFDADEFVVAAGGEGDFAAVEMGDAVDAAVEQVAVMRDDEGGAGEFGEPGFEPHGGFEVEVVGGFVEQEHVGRREQDGGEGHAHAPAAGEGVDRAGLGVGVEAEAGEDGRGARGRCVSTNGEEAVMHFGEAVGVGVGVVGFGEEGEAFLVAFQHAVEQGDVAVGRLLPDLAEAGAGGEADGAAVDADFAGDGFEQGGLAGAVAADQADAAAGVDGEVGLVQQETAGNADGDAADDKETHEGGLPAVWFAGEGVVVGGALL